MRESTRTRHSEQEERGIMKGVIATMAHAPATVCSSSSSSSSSAAAASSTSSFLHLWSSSSSKHRKTGRRACSQFSGRAARHTRLGHHHHKLSLRYDPFLMSCYSNQVKFLLSWRRLLRTCFHGRVLEVNHRLYRTVFHSRVPANWEGR